jgi:hypothetical protein
MKSILLLCVLGVLSHSIRAAEPAVIPYPLTECIVTDNDLGSMGDEKRIVYEGREIKFCCAACVGKFLKKPEHYLKKLAPSAAAPEKNASPEPPLAAPPAN